VRKNYQRKQRKSNHKFEVVQWLELMVHGNFEVLKSAPES
jgi:hypothetical protein